MLDVLFRDCITPECLQNRQTNEAENNVIIKKIREKRKGTFGGPILEVVEACNYKKKNILLKC